MKKIFLSLLFLPLFLVFPSNVSASGNFSVIKVSVDPANNHFVFSADRFVVDFPVTISLVAADHSTIYATSSSFSNYADFNTSGIFNSVNSYPSCDDSVVFDFNDGSNDNYSYPISVSKLYKSCSADTSFPTPPAPSTIYTVGSSNSGLGLGNLEFHDWSGPITPTDCDASRSYVWDGNVGVIPFTSCSPDGATLAQNLVPGHFIQLFYYDSSGNYWTSSFAARIPDQMYPRPELNLLSGATINAGDTYSENGSFDSNDSFFTATVDYGDGSGSQPLTLSGEVFALNHTYNNFGNYLVKVNIIDSEGVTGTTYTTVVVNPLSPQINFLNGGTIATGDTYSENGSFTDPDSTSWIATVDYGDGSGAQPLILNSDNTFTLSHQYSNTGTYTVTVNVTDNQGNTRTATTQVIVNSNAIAPVVGQITSNPSQVKINTSTGFSVNFTDANTSDTHTSSWNWGDGHTSNGIVTESNGSGSVSDNHTYTALGSYTITLTVTDSTNLSSTAQSVIAVILTGGLTQANLSHTNYNGASFSGLNLTKVNGTNAQFQNVDFSSATLTQSNFSNSNLTGSNFTNANLNKANLSNTNLSNVNFTGANLTQANLSNTTRTGIVWSNTTCPNGQNSNYHNNSCVGQGGGL